MTEYTVVGVAQLVEPRIVIPVVVGSSPIAHPTPSFRKSLFGYSGLRSAASVLLPFCVSGPVKIPCACLTPPERYRKIPAFVIGA